MNGITFRAMTASEFEAYKAWSIQDYAQNMADEGQFATLAEAMTESEKDFAEGLPNGLATPDSYLFIAQNADSEDIGMLWYETANPGRAFIEDFLILPQYRRRGYGLQVLDTLGEVLSARGIYRIILHVFESNHSARKLYEKSGFAYLEAKNAEAGSLYMAKNLPAD